MPLHPVSRYTWEQFHRMVYRTFQTLAQIYRDDRRTERGIKTFVERQFEANKENVAVEAVTVGWDDDGEVQVTYELDEYEEPEDFEGSPAEQLGFWTGRDTFLINRFV